MTKKVFALALLALSLTGLSATAGQNTDSKAQGKELKKELKGEHKHINPFEGLNLTEAQQNSIKQLNANRKEARKAQMKANKENRKKMKAEMRNQHKASKKAYLNEVKAILTPEQYVSFLENSYMNASGRKGHKNAMHNKGDKKKDRRDTRHDGKKQDKKNS